MKTTFVSKENNVVKFDMEFTAEEFEKAVNDVYKQQKNRFQIDGFRKGKAPRSLIEKRYGEGIFYDDAINNIFSANYAASIKELDLNVIDRPVIDFDDIKKGEPFVLKVEVECYPEVEVKDYKGVEINKIVLDVTDDDVEASVKSLARRNSRMVTVEDRPAQDGDMILIDYEGSVDGETFEGGTAERYPLKLGSGTFIPGFEEQLVGVSSGEEKDVIVTFPEDYHESDLAGAEAVFKCKVHEIKYEEIPEIDDEFVKDVSEFDTLEELKADERQKLEKRNAETAESTMRSSAMEKVYDANKLDVPDAMVETELDSMTREFDQQLRAQGLDMEAYFKYLGEDSSEFRTQMRDEAVKRVRMRMITLAIAEQEGFEVTDEEIEAELESMAEQYDLEASAIKGMIGEENLNMISNDLKIKKAFEFVYENAVVTESAPEEAAEAAEAESEPQENEEAQE